MSQPIPPGMKIAAQMSAEPTESDFRFVRQMGVEYAVVWTDAAHAGYDYYASRRDLFESHELKIYGLGNFGVHNQDAIVLNLADRDSKIAEYQRHLRALGKTGIPYTTYAHMANGIWTSGREQTRGGASARALDMDNNPWGWWQGQRYALPLSHGRQYSDQEIWDNYTHFIQEVVPVAEDSGVLIGIHPDDPPLPMLAGVPRCIFSNFEGYQRAMEIADSPNVGICFCVGCWLEGGDLMGKDVIESIRHFGGQGKIHKVHFRNVDAPLPHFVETFVDDGYADLFPVMKELQATGFRGVLIPDHIPIMSEDGRAETAYTIGYMKALIARAEAEVTATHTSTTSTEAPN